MLRSFQQRMALLAGVIVLIWVVHIANVVFFHGALVLLGVHPHQPFGLVGIVTMPFLHRDLTHLVHNTVPLVVFGWLAMLRRIRDFFYVCAIVMFVAGVGTWLIGATHSVHVGASGIVFGLFAYLVTSAWFARSIGAILVAVLVMMFYGGLVWGVLPLRAGISWEAHLTGLVGGVVAAWWLRRRRSNLP